MDGREGWAFDHARFSGIIGYVLNTSNEGTLQRNHTHMGVIVSIVAFGTVEGTLLAGTVQRITPEIGWTVEDTQVISIPGKLILRTLVLTYAVLGEADSKGNPVQSVIDSISIVGAHRHTSHSPIICKQIAWTKFTAYSLASCYIETIVAKLAYRNTLFGDIISIP